MRIAVVNQPWSRFQLPVDRADSISIWAYQVARRLPSRFQHTMLVRGNPGQAQVETHTGINYRRLPYWPKFRGYGLVQLARDALGCREPGFSDPAYHRRFAAWAGATAARVHAQVVHIHNFAQFVPVMRHLNPHARVVLHMHCEWLSQLPAAKVGPWVEQCHAIWGCSQHVTRKIQAQFPAMASRCVTVPNGTELPAVAIKPPAPAAHRPPAEIAFVGRLSPEKGVHVLIAAFIQLADTLPHATLRLVGPDAPTPQAFLVDLDPSPHVRDLRRFYPGSYLNQLKALVPPRLRSRVEFAGELPPHRLAEVYGRASVLANPSLSEAFGMSLVEAMAAQVPVVAAAVGGMPEVLLGGDAGLLVPPNDAKALASALTLALKQTTETQTRVKQAYAHVQQHYDWRVVAQRAGQAYDDLVAT